MALSYIQGNDVLLYLGEAASSSNIKLWGCCRNVVLNGETETIEITPIDGKNTNFLPTYNGATLDADGIYIIPEYTDPQWSSNQLWEWRINQTLLYWKLVFAKVDGSEDIYEGTCYLTRTNISGAVNDVAGVTISAVVVSGGQSSQEVSYSCPVMTLDSGLFSVSYSFFDNGEGVTKYYVELLDNADQTVDVDVVTSPFSSPITGSFTGLDTDTLYKVRISLEVDSPYFQRVCTAVNISTDALIEYNAFGGATQEEACDETNPITFWASGIGVGQTLYTTAAGTTTFSAYAYINVFGTVYTVNVITGVITANVGNCSGTGTPYTVGVGNTRGAACADLTDSPITVYSVSTSFETGMVVYLDAALTTPVTGFNFIVEQTSTSIYLLNSSNGTVGSNEGVTC